MTTSPMFVGADGVQYALASAVAPRFRVDEKTMCMAHRGAVHRFVRKAGNLPKDAEDWAVFTGTWTKAMVAECKEKS